MTPGPRPARLEQAFTHRAHSMVFLKVDPQLVPFRDGSRFTTLVRRAPRGWNNGMLAQTAGRTLFIAGKTARDGSGQVPAADFVSQFDRALGNVLAVLRQAGGELGDIGRFTIYVTDMTHYRTSLKPLGEVYRRRMGTHFPAMVLVEVTSLVDPQAVVEIEATAVLG